jgi:hypothetical protein
MLTSGEETVVITFESRFLHGKLPSKLMFTKVVLNKIRLSSLTLVLYTLIIMSFMSQMMC